MPRKKLTPEEIQRQGAAMHKRMVYMAAHPEERAKATQKAKERDRRARLKRLAKHQPFLTDIQSNGKYVTVAFIRENGDLWYGDYKLWNHFSQVEYDRELTRLFRRCAVGGDAGPGKRPPDQEETPRSC